MKFVSLAFLCLAGLITRVHAALTKGTIQIKAPSAEKGVTLSTLFDEYDADVIASDDQPALQVQIDLERAQREDSDIEILCKGQTFTYLAANVRLSCHATPGEDACRQKMHRFYPSVGFINVQQTPDAHPQQKENAFTACYPNGMRELPFQASAVWRYDPASRKLTPKVLALNGTQLPVVVAGGWYEGNFHFNAISPSNQTGILLFPKRGVKVPQEALPSRGTEAMCSAWVRRVGETMSGKASGKRHLAFIEIISKNSLRQPIERHEHEVVYVAEVHPAVSKPQNWGSNAALALPAYAALTKGTIQIKSPSAEKGVTLSTFFDDYDADIIATENQPALQVQIDLERAQKEDSDIEVLNGFWVPDLYRYLGVSARGRAYLDWNPTFYPIVGFINVQQTPDAYPLQKENAFTACYPNGMQELPFQASAIWRYDPANRKLTPKILALNGTQLPVIVDGGWYEGNFGFSAVAPSNRTGEPLLQGRVCTLEKGEAARTKFQCELESPPGRESISRTFGSMRDVVEASKRNSPWGTNRSLDSSGIPRLFADPEATLHARPPLALHLPPMQSIGYAISNHGSLLIGDEVKLLQAKQDGLAFHHAK
ncbi:hypothetical protein NMY22_g15643 [Coprinellus aureogranulatus]|nr:hypothetical protein NMY22_g15643 [Coprinellus aureogranulatus]